MASEILLDSGTNEVELLEFYLGDEHFGINVLKVRQVIAYEPDKIVPMPSTGDYVLGNFMYQGKTVPLIDLRLFLNKDNGANPEDTQLVSIISEFNNRLTAFLVDGLNKIFRINWDDIQAPSFLVKKFKPNITGVTTVDDNEMMILDFESIVAKAIGFSIVNVEADANKPVEEEQMEMPESLPVVEESPQEIIETVPEVVEPVGDEPKEFSRGDLQFIFADDSSVIRDQMAKLFTESGFSNFIICNDGQAAYDTFTDTKRDALEDGVPLTDYLNVIVTDIEMPKMDGLTLCKKVKEENPEIFVGVVSSLITKQMKGRCQEVKADVALSKNEAVKILKFLEAIVRKYRDQ